MADLKAHRDHPIDMKLAIYAPTVKQPVLRYPDRDGRLAYAGVRERQFLQFSAYGTDEEDFPYAWVCPDPHCRWDQKGVLVTGANGDKLWWQSSNGFGPVLLKKTRDLKRDVIRKHNSKLHQSELIISDPDVSKRTVDR